jgi:uncharacterized repeat protein (TIGR01451 family)
MLGLWKLGAMSAVIGAGVVVVWQAQQGLNPTTDAAPPAAVAELGTAANSPTPIAEPSQPANASVPPEAETPTRELTTEFGDAPALELSAPPPLPTRGLDFRKLPDDGALSEAATSPTPRSIIDDDQWARDSGTSVKSEVLSAPPSLSAPANPDPSVRPIAADAADPFTGSAPPELGPVPASDPRLQTEPAAEPFDPFGGEPELKEKAPPAAPVENVPAQAEPDPFDPFPADKPAAPAAPVDRKPARLPIDLDAAPDPVPPAEKASSSSRMESRPRLPIDLDAVPKVEERRPAPTKPPADALLGDAELPVSPPRSLIEPRLTIEKSAPPKASLGQPLIYSILVKNTGASPATQVTVEDRIPKGTRLVGTAPRAELVEKRLTWKLGTIPPGEERKIAIKVIPEEEGAIGSVARVTFVSEVAAEIVVTSPKLKLAVRAPQEVKVGSTAELIYTLSNPGDGAASNVIIRSLIPEGFQHPAGNDLEYSLGTLAPMESRDVRLELTAIKPGRLIHRTVVTADGNFGTESQTPVEVVGEQLLLTRSGHNKIFLGRQAVYTNTVTNEGPRPIDRVQITESVPAGFDFVKASQDGRYDSSQRQIVWTVGPISPGDKLEVSSTLAAKSLGDFTSAVTAQGQTGSTASVQPTITIEGFPSLAVEPVGEQKLVAIGEQVTSRIQLRNKGTATAKNVGLTITLPPELRLISAKGPGTYKQEASRLVFDPIDEVLASGVLEFQLVFEAQAAGDSRLEMQISADHLRRPVRHEEAVQVVGN